MHPEARAGFVHMLAASGVNATHPLTVLDLGGQDVNGTVHEFFTRATITTLDLENADIVADATNWVPDKEYDLVISTELLEHVRDWSAVLRTAWLALKPGGVFVGTCASTDRPTHGATGAPEPAFDEWYANVDAGQLRAYLGGLFKTADVLYNYPPGDAYWWAAK